jgi:fatty acid kinase fatty acid binding subunit
LPRAPFRVVTDSTADLPDEWRERYAIDVVPLKTLFGEESFRDGVDLSGDQFFERLQGVSKLPTTSAPSPGDFTAVYERLAKETDAVISIHIGSQLSATCEAARVGAEAVDGLRVEVVDSHSVTMCVAFLCRLAAESESLEAALAAVRERIPRLRILALLDTLRYIEMGGRISKLQYLLGSMLDMKAIMRVADGEITPAARTRTRSKAIAELLALFEQDLPVESVAVMHGAAPADAEELKARLPEDLRGRETPVRQIGSVLGTHTGPRALGLAYVKKA